MKPPILLYGASDDLIEVEGAVREEWDYSDGENGDYIIFSTGDVVRITFTPSGIWRITFVVRATDSPIEFVPCEGDGNGDDYSDRLAVINATWAAHTTTFELAS